MELGGNKLAHAFYDKNGMLLPDGSPNHKAPQLAKYKQDLARKSEIEILASAGIQNSIAVENKQVKTTIAYETQQPVVK